MTDVNTKIRITADTAQAQTALTSLKTALGGFASALTGALSIGAFAGFIKSSIDLQAELGALSKKTGILPSELAGIKFAADQSGSSIDMIAKGVGNLAVNMASTPDTFKRLGIDARDATGALVQISDIVSKMPDGLQKTALLAELMGKKVGPEMAEFLSLGGAAIQDYIAKGKDIYKVTDAGAASAKLFKDQMAELGASITGAGVSITADLLPPLIEYIKQLTAGTEIAGGFFKAILLFGTMNPLKTAGESVKSLREEIEGLQESRERYIKSNSDTSSIDMAISALQKKIEFAKYLQREEALALGKGYENYKMRIALPKSVQDLLDGAKAQKGDAVIGGLAIDYRTDFGKKLREQNAPMMSAADKQYADNLAAIEVRAARANESIGKLNTTDTERTRLLAEVNALETEQIGMMDALRIQVEQNNASAKYGMQTALRDYVDEVANVAKQTQNLFSTAFKGMEDALVSFVQTGKLDFSSLANSITADLIRIQVQQSITGPLALMLGGFGKGSVPAGGSGASIGTGYDGSFDGGGFTGYGSRSGGIDGKGGFPAILHPNETVLDHTKGQGMGNVINLTYAPVTSIDARSDIAQVQQIAEASARRNSAELVDKLQRAGAL